jgi:hypothetical protein
MAVTYEPIATSTLVSAATSITFSSIASSWTDIRVVLNAVAVDSNSAAITFQFNSDTASNYSNTTLTGNGTTASSGRTSNRSDGIYSASTAQNAANGLFLIEAEIFSYAGSTNKTVLIASSDDANGTGIVTRAVGLWRNTAAITTVKINKAFGGNFGVGTTATLYGIKNA